MIIFKKSQPLEILKFLYVLYGDFRIMRFVKKPHKWFFISELLKLPNEELLGKMPNQRMIMPDEVVFDIDVEKHNYKYNLEGLSLAKRIHDKLLSDGLKSSVWFSGGSGYHIHLFFPELKNYSKPQRKLIKELILKYYGRGFLNPKRTVHVCLAPKTLIQLENAIHRRLEGFKTFEFGFDTSECFNNKMPKFILEKYEEIKDKVRLIIKKPFLAQGEEPPCIKFILSNDFLMKKDGRKRALFILASYYKKIGLGEDEIINKLIEWNRYELNNYLRESQITSTVKSANGTIGCYYIKSFLEELNINLCKECHHQLITTTKTT